jgi:hypothetical protein
MIHHLHAPNEPPGRGRLRRCGPTAAP